MYNRLLFLAALAVIAVGAASGDMTVIPASQDVYFNLASEQVFNNTDVLRCEVGVVEVNGSKEETFSGIPMIQFDISDLNITDNDIGVLVLKAASIEKGNDSAMVAMLPISSQWNEGSDFVEFLMNFLPIWNIVKKNDISQMGISTDDDAIFAFDISGKLRDAKGKGDLISFLLLPISNSSYKVDFMSRETGSGPYLCVAPYPAKQLANLTLTQIPPIEYEDDIGGMVNETAANETVMNETAENETIPILTNETQDMAQTDLGYKEIQENQAAIQA